MADSKKYQIQVDVKTAFIPDQSDANDNRYVFAYTINISNVGNVAAQLISRHWLITDAEGEVQEVRGLGVIGEQPFLQPGTSFEYTSGCALTTPVGIMRGSYQLTAEDGVQFEANIPEFVLSMPRVLH
ncbi:MAG: Co2+/Mg2+ efflux protein ApaG [Rhodocyclaceae bacterium]|jgi:ApaG protein|nr:Co2+/Mg2+ efflux protein ApaG [Rhodocyclaceae bacterium]